MWWRWWWRGWWQFCLKLLGFTDASLPFNQLRCNQSHFQLSLWYYCWMEAFVTMSDMMMIMVVMKVSRWCSCKWQWWGLQWKWNAQNPMLWTSLPWTVWLDAMLSNPFQRNMDGVHLTFNVIWSTLILLSLLFGQLWFYFHCYIVYIVGVDCTFTVIWSA